jgi:hypothetical protein
MTINATIEKSQAQIAALNAKAIEFAEENAKSAFTFTRDALAVKTPDALWSLQQTFLKAQQDAGLRQVESLSKFYADWMKEAAAPMTDALKPFMPKTA